MELWNCCFVLHAHEDRRTTTNHLYMYMVIDIHREGEIGRGPPPRSNDSERMMKGSFKSQKDTPYAPVQNDTPCPEFQQIVVA